MTLDQYRNETIRTLPDLGTSLLNSIHMTMGMMTELTEIVTLLTAAFHEYDPNKLVDEVGDLCWYLSNYANFHAIKFIKTSFEKFNELSPLDYMIISAGLLLDIDKKHLAYKKNPYQPLRELHAQKLLNGIIAFCEENFIDVEQVMEKNITKLRVRFPDKFDAYLAINKNEDKEGEVFYE